MSLFVLLPEIEGEVLARLDVLGMAWWTKGKSLALECNHLLEQVSLTRLIVLRPKGSCEVIA
jgi:hypothetical protein